MTLADRLDITVAVHHTEWSKHIPGVREISEKITVRCLEMMEESFRQHVPDMRLPVGIAIVLTDGKEIQELNHRFRGKNSPTNVLSFPADYDTVLPELDEMVLGDVIIAWDVIAQEAAEQGKSFPHHFTHMLVHGLLHLLGFDHISDTQAVVMEQHEREILISFGIPDPYIERNPMTIMPIHEPGRANENHG